MATDLIAYQAGSGPPGLDRPDRTRRGSRDGVFDLVGSAVASLAAVWLVFSLAGVSMGNFGFVFCWAVLSYAIYGVLVWRRHGVLLMKDRLATVAIWSGAVVALIALAAVVLYVAVKGWPIVGTAEQVFIATVISVPIAFLTATYLVQSRSALARLARVLVDAMTGTPSIIAGLFMYIIWVAPHGVNGKNGFIAALTLSIMMIPVTCRAAYEVIRIVPGSLREAAHALGAPERRVVLRVVLPTARVGLITAALLGIARTAGETAEVLFTAGGNANFNWNPFHGWQDDLPLRIYEQVFQPSSQAITIGWGAAFVLMAFVLILFTLARFLGSRGSNRRRLPPLLRRRAQPEIQLATES
jgi:phosphate transport system permease protein